MLWGIEAGSQWSGNWVTPKGIPIIVVAIILRNKAPFTLRAIRTPLNTIPMIPRIAVGVNLPKVTNVAGEATITPAFFNPMNAINMPIPTDIA